MRTIDINCILRRSIIALMLLLVVRSHIQASESEDVFIAAPSSLEVLGHMLRGDLLSDRQPEVRYEAQRSESPNGPFNTLNNPLLMLFLYSDYIGETNKTYYYRVRTIPVGGDESTASEWSKVVYATTHPYNREGFLTEVQEAESRY